MIGPRKTRRGVSSPEEEEEEKEEEEAGSILNRSSAFPQDIQRESIRRKRGKDARKCQIPASH